MAKYCTHCGKEINETATFCTYCGCMVPGASLKPGIQTPTYVYASPKTAIVLGIIGIVFAWLFALVGHITSIIGIVIGIKEYRETDQLAGITLSIIGEICSIISSILGAVAMVSLL